MPWIGCWLVGQRRGSAMCQHNTIKFKITLNNYLEIVMHLYHFILLIPKCHISSTAISFKLNALSLNFYSYFNFFTRVSQLSSSRFLKTLNIDKLTVNSQKFTCLCIPSARVKAMCHYTQRNKLLKKQNFWRHKAYT